MSFTAQILTLYPEMFPGPLGVSLAGRALSEGKWACDPIHIRDFASDRHRTVDDTPAGGGAGMVLRADIMGRAIEHALRKGPGPLIYLSPRGRRFDQAMARSLATTPGAIFICGRFEGLDQRVIEHYGITEVSLGDFVMTGGELAAQAVIDATVRLLPGVLGNEASAEEESFSNGLLEHPHYTKPADWHGHRKSDVLLLGHHGEIAKWRQAQSEAITRARRPDLWEAWLAQQG